MRQVIEIINEVVKIIDEYNRKAGLCSALNPMFETQYSLHTTYPFSLDPSVQEQKNGFEVKISISYESGGGIETSYALEDIFSFNVSENKIIYIMSAICMEEEKKYPDMELNQNNITSLLSAIHEFCDTRIPKDPVF